LGLGIQPTELAPPAGTGAEHIVPEVDIANDVAGSQSNGPEPTYLQLQYSQMVILVFNGVLWPHVTVATLRLSSG
jgi:hypothetical protein